MSNKDLHPECAWDSIRTLVGNCTNEVRRCDASLKACQHKADRLADEVRRLTREYTEAMADNTKDPGYTRYIRLKLTDDLVEMNVLADQAKRAVGRAEAASARWKVRLAQALEILKSLTGETNV